MVNPYVDNGDIRIFSAEVEVSDLVWHRDREDRKVKVLEGENWSFQYEDQLPFKIKPGDEFFIEKMSYHRLIQGTTTLKLLIEKHYD